MVKLTVLLGIFWNMLFFGDGVQLTYEEVDGLAEWFWRAWY